MPWNSRETPSISFFEVRDEKGMEAIEQIRNNGGDEDE